MARQGNTKFVGTVENLIYYKWKSLYSIRTKPGSVQQTASSIRQSNLFGMAAHTGAVLRRLLKGVLPDSKDRKMMRRFEQVIVQWLRTNAITALTLQQGLPFITGFEFNEENPLRKLLQQTVTAAVRNNNSITVSLLVIQPVQDIAAPAETRKVILRISAAACSLYNNDISDAVTKEIPIIYDESIVPASEVELPVTLQEGMLAVVVVSLQFVLNTGTIVAEQLLPAAIVESIWVNGKV